MFYVKQLRYLVLIFSVFFCAFTQAKDNYAEWIQDIEHRLDKTAHLYQQGQADEARTEVQMAYFEVFENLEGPIRINFSAQKSYQMEATFAEIRKMIGEGVSLEAIQTKINGLKSELQEVLPVLTDGHQLNASAQHDVYSNQTIAQHWQQSFKIIDDLLAQAISAYEQGEFAQAKKWVQQAQYDGFKNAEMEMAIRQNRSASISASINQQFYDLIRLSEKPDQLNNLGYQITLLLQEIEEQLPNLPTTRETQVVQAQVNSTDNTPDQDWQKVTNEINQRIQQAMNLYQQGEQKKAMLAVQDTYFDVFESSGMENKIGARDSNMKAELEGYFTRLVSLIKANASSDQLQQQANQLAQGLSKSVEMLQGGKQSHWSMFLYLIVP